MAQNLKKIWELLLRLGGALNRNKNAEVKMSKKFLTSDPLGVILCGESIARTPEP